MGFYMDRESVGRIRRAGGVGDPVCGGLPAVRRRDRGLPAVANVSGMIWGIRVFFGEISTEPEWAA